MTSVDRYDLIVIGSGIAGLNAALAAARTGLSVVVIEKTAKLGGATCWSYGALWIAGNAQAADAGIVDSAESAEAYLHFLGAGEADPERARALVANASRVLANNEAEGVHFALMPAVNDLLYGKAPGALNEGRTLEPYAISGATLGAWREKLRMPPDDDWWRVMRSVIVRMPDPAAIDAAVAEALAGDQLAQGPAIIGGLLLALARYDVPIMLETGAESLIAQDGAIVGVSTANGPLTASNVLIATGSYKGNEQMVATLDKLPGYRPYFPPTANGDGLVMASKVGASIRHTRNNVVVMLGFDNPADPQGLQAGAPSTRELPRAHAIVVNAAGARFGNEASFQELSRDIRVLDWKTRTPRNLPCWMIADHQYVSRWGLGGSAPGEVPSFVTVAPDITSLASAACIDPAGLTATVDRINGFAESGIDEDFGRAPGWALVPGSGSGKNPSLGSVSQPPYYAVRLLPTLGVAGSGVKADEAGRVLDWRDEAIPGLYCAGDAALHDEFGAGYQAGVTYASAMTFAWLAVEDMVIRKTAA